MQTERSFQIARSPGLIDILDRILDKGLAVVGDIRISLGNVDLVLIQIRLLVCSADKAEQIGLDWWRSDPFFSGPPSLSNDELRSRVKELETKLNKLRQQKIA